MKKLLYNKGFMMVLVAIASISTIATLAISRDARTITSAAEEVSPFWSTTEYNSLFMVEGYGNLYSSLIRKGDVGNETGAWGFCLNKNKAFPRHDKVLYTTNAYNDWTYVLDSGAAPNPTQIARANRVMYAYNFVFKDRLTEFGLGANDLGELYHATQIALWATMEDWTPNDIKIQAEVYENPALLSIAEKTHGLITAMYNYAVNDSNATFVEGTKLVVEGTGQEVSTSYKLSDSDLVLYPEGAFYRSQALYFTPRQEKGIVTSGDYRFTFEVSLPADAPAGSRIVDFNGNPKTTFALEEGNVFYVEVPIGVVVNTTGSLEVTVSAKTFRRSHPLVWSPQQTAYQAIGMLGLFADSGEAKYSVNWAKEDEAPKYLAEIVVNKFGEQPNGFVTNGDVNDLTFEQLPLDRTSFKLKIYSVTGAKIINGTDGKKYFNGGELQGSVDHTTNAKGQTVFSGLPMDADNDQVIYEITEYRQAPGFTLGTEITQRVTLTKKANEVVAGKVDYVNQRIKYVGQFTKVEEYVSNLGTMQTSNRPVKDVVFGVYNATEINGLPADSLIGKVTSNTDGYVSIDGLDLPSNFEFYLKEISAPSHLVVSNSKIYFNTYTEAGYNEDFKEVTFMNEDFNKITEVVNYPAKGKLGITKRVQVLNPETLELEYVGVTVDNFGNFKFGIYADSECTIEVGKLEVLEGTQYLSADLNPGTYYVKEVATGALYDIDETVYEVKVVANETTDVVINNDLTEVSLSLAKVDATDPTNKFPLSNVTFNLLLGDKVVQTAKTDNDGKITFTGIKVGYKYTLSEVVPVGYASNNANITVDFTNNTDGTNPHYEIENYKNEVLLNIKVIKKDKETNQLLQGVQFGIYSESDTALMSPLKIEITNEHGELTFDGLAPAKYVIKETKALENYLISNETFTVDLTNKEHGYTETVEVFNEKYVGSIKVVKTDETKEKFLAGAKFGLYQGDTLLAEATTSNEGVVKFNNVPYGVYTVKELVAPNGYAKTDEVFTVSVTDKNITEYVVTVVNKIVKGNIKIVKMDNDNRGVKLSGAVFRLYSIEDTEFKNHLAEGITDAGGEVHFKDLPLGKYVIVETSAPAGYKEAVKDTIIDMTNGGEGDTYVVSIYNIKKTSVEEKPKPPTVEIEVPHTGIGSDLGMLASFAGIIISALLIIMLAAISFKNKV